MTEAAIVGSYGEIERPSAHSKHPRIAGLKASETQRTEKFVMCIYKGSN